MKVSLQLILLDGIYSEAFSLRRELVKKKNSSRACRAGADAASAAAVIRKKTLPALSTMPLTIAD